VFFEGILFGTAIIVSVYCIFRTLPFIQVLWARIRGKNPPKKLKSHDPSELTHLLILFIALLTLWVSFFTYKDEAELNKKNKLFLQSADSIIESAKTVNQQSVSFQTESLKSLKSINNQAQSILGSANEMGKRSNEFLEASKGSLETFKNASQDLKEILKSNIELSNKQVSIMNENYKREVELLNRTANISISFGNVDLIHRNINVPIPIDIDPLAQWKKLNFLFGNTGLVPLKKPVVLFTADPSTVCLNGSNGDEGCNSVQFSGVNVIDGLNPGTLNKFSIEVKIPDGLSSFKVNISTSGEGLQSPVETSVTFIVNRIKPIPTPVPHK
jgi:hypothetical protein